MITREFTAPHSHGQRSMRFQSAQVVRRVLGRGVCPFGKQALRVVVCYQLPRSSSPSIHAHALPSIYFLNLSATVRGQNISLRGDKGQSS